MSIHIEYVETPLTLQQQFRLVEIAHETTDYELRSVALTILRHTLNPLCRAVMMKDDGQT